MTLPTTLPPLARSYEIAFERIARADGSPDPERFRVAISSEAPVRQYFGWEILDHGKASVDLTRAKRGLALRVVEDLDRGHYAGVQVGLIEEIELDENARELKGVARFGRSGKAQEVKQDVQDGIRRFLSVSYRISKMVLESDDKEKGPTYRATRWQPQEVAIVAVPADITVGFGRSAGPDAAVEIVTAMDWPAEHARIGAIVELGVRYRIGCGRVDHWIDDGVSVDQVKGELLDLFHTPLFGR